MGERAGVRWCSGIRGEAFPVFWIDQKLAAARANFSEHFAPRLTRIAVTSELLQRLVQNSPFLIAGSGSAYKMGLMQNLRFGHTLKISSTLAGVSSTVSSTVELGISTVD